MSDLPSSSNASISPALDAKAEERKKKGEAHLEKVLEEARKGVDPFNRPPSNRAKRNRPRDIEHQDKDLEAVGLVLEGSKLYVIGAFFLASCTARLVLLKLSLAPLHTPAVQMFLHLLPAVGMSYALLEIGPLTGKTLRGSAVSATLHGIKTLALFGALNYSSVYLVLSWTTLVPPALKYQRSLLQNRSPGLFHTLLLALGASAGGVALVSRLWPSLLGLLCLLAWAAMEAGQLLWAFFTANPEISIPQLEAGEAMETLRQLAREEAETSTATLSFFKSALPAVPALLVGFICREGSELVDHELSVPAVSMMLLSCAAWTVCTVTGVLLIGTISTQNHQRLTCASAPAALVLQAVMNGVGPPAALAAAGLAVVGGIAAQQFGLPD